MCIEFAINRSCFFILEAMPVQYCCGGIRHTTRTNWPGYSHSNKIPTLRMKRSNNISLSTSSDNDSGICLEIFHFHAAPADDLDLGSSQNSFSHLGNMLSPESYY